MCGRTCTYRNYAFVWLSARSQALGFLSYGFLLYREVQQLLSPQNVGYATLAAETATVGETVSELGSGNPGEPNVRLKCAGYAGDVVATAGARALSHSSGSRRAARSSWHSRDRLPWSHASPARSPSSLTQVAIGAEQPIRGSVPVLSSAVSEVVDFADDEISRHSAPAEPNADTPALSALSRIHRSRSSNDGVWCSAAAACAHDVDRPESRFATANAIRILPAPVEDSWSGSIATGVADSDLGTTAAGPQQISHSVHVVGSSDVSESSTASLNNEHLHVHSQSQPRPTSNTAPSGAESEHHLQGGTNPMKKVMWSCLVCI